MTKAKSLEESLKAIDEFFNNLTIEEFDEMIIKAEAIPKEEEKEKEEE